MLVFEVYHPTKLKSGHSHLWWQCHYLVTLLFHCQRRRCGSACVLIADLGGSLQIDQQCISLITDTITRSIKHSYPCHDWWTSNHLLARSTVVRFTLRRIGNIQNSLALTKKPMKVIYAVLAFYRHPNGISDDRWSLSTAEGLDYNEKKNSVVQSAYGPPSSHVHAVCLWQSSPALLAFTLLSYSLTFRCYILYNRYIRWAFGGLPKTLFVPAA